MVSSSQLFASRASALPFELKSGGGKDVSFYRLSILSVAKLLLEIAYIPRDKQTHDIRLANTVRMPQAGFEPTTPCFQSKCFDVLVKCSKARGEEASSLFKNCIA